MNCPHCDRLVQPGARFCEQCGQALPSRPQLGLHLNGEVIVGSVLGAVAAVALGLIITWIGVATAIDQAARGGGVFGALGALYARGSQWQLSGLTYYSAHFIALKGAGGIGRMPLPLYAHLIPAIAVITGGWLAARLIPELPARQVAVATGVAYAIVLWILRPMFSLTVFFVSIIPGGFSTLFLAGLLGTGLAWIGAAIHRGSLHA